jgi:hypothetical protein
MTPAVESIDIHTRMQVRAISGRQSYMCAMQHNVTSPS